MGFFNHLHNSLWNLEWLEKTKKNFKKSFGYFLLFILLLTAVDFIPFYKPISQFPDTAKTFLTQEVPDFTATIKDGSLLVDIGGLEHPYIKELFVDLDEFDGVDTNESSEKGSDVVLYIDTQHDEPLNVMQLVDEQEVDTVFLFTKDQFSAYSKSEGELRGRTFANIPDAEFSRTDGLTILEKWDGPMVWLIILGLMALMFVIVVIGKLIFNALLSLVVLLVSHVGKKGWTYKEIYTLSLSTIYLPSILLTLAVFAIGYEPPFAYTIIYLVVTLAVIFDFNRHKKSSK